jgi:hypothetical protein
MQPLILREQTGEIASEDIGQAPIPGQQFIGPLGRAIGQSDGRIS